MRSIELRLFKAVTNPDKAHRDIFTGIASSGKTTQLNHLPKVQVSPEMFRLHAEQIKDGYNLLSSSIAEETKVSIKAKYDPCALATLLETIETLQKAGVSDFCTYMSSQQATNDAIEIRLKAELAVPHDKLTVFDRSLIDIFAYADVYKSHFNPDQLQIIVLHLLLHRVHRVLHFAALKLVHDGIRSETAAQREQLQEAYIDNYRKVGYQPGQQLIEIPRFCNNKSVSIQFRRKLIDIVLAQPMDHFLRTESAKNAPRNDMRIYHFIRFDRTHFFKQKSDPYEWLDLAESPASCILRETLRTKTCSQL